jgi:hypothetical protein
MRPFVNAAKVAPDAERCAVFVFVAAAVRAKREVMRRYVFARADGARATEGVAPVHVVDSGSTPELVKRWRRSAGSQMRQRFAQRNPRKLVAVVTRPTCVARLLQSPDI